MSSKVSVEPIEDVAVGAGLDVDGEDAYQVLHGGHGGKGLVRLFLVGFAFWPVSP